MSKYQSIIRCMKAAFYRPDYQKLFMCPLIKRLGQTFVPKHADKLLKGPTELLKHSAELLKYSTKFLSVWDKTKSSAESSKNSAACLCHNTTHAVPISQRVYNFKVLKSSVNIFLILDIVITKDRSYFSR